MLAPAHRLRRAAASRREHTNRSRASRATVRGRRAPRRYRGAGQQHRYLPDFQAFGRRCASSENILRRRPLCRKGRCRRVLDRAMSGRWSLSLLRERRRAANRRGRCDCPRRSAVKNFRGRSAPDRGRGGPGQSRSNQRRTLFRSSRAWRGRRPGANRPASQVQSGMP